MRLTTTLITSDDLRRVVEGRGLDSIMDETIDALTEALSGFDPSTSRVAVREGFTYTRPKVGLLEWMPALELGGRATIKVVGYHPANPTAHGLPTILSTVALFEAETGHLEAIMDGTYLTAVRTGAASAVASRVLASSETRSLGLIGCGAQALTQLHAISRVYPLSTVYLYDTVAGQSARLAARTTALVGDGVDVRVSTLESLVASSDVICTQTSVDIGKGPVFEDGPTREHLHVNAVGSDLPDKTELPISLLKRSFVCPDFPEQAKREGECQQIDEREVGADLAEVVRTPEKFAIFRVRPSVFDSTGFALEDQVAARLLYDIASEMGLGTDVAIESASDDPYDPYAFALSEARHPSL